jgi:hypothetical protein
MSPVSSSSSPRAVRRRSHELGSGLRQQAAVDGDELGRKVECAGKSIGNSEFEVARHVRGYQPYFVANGTALRQSHFFRYAAQHQQHGFGIGRQRLEHHREGGAFAAADLNSRHKLQREWGWHGVGRDSARTRIGPSDCIACRRLLVDVGR